MLVGKIVVSISVFFNHNGDGMVFSFFVFGVLEYNEGYWVL
jgi:hypothetical protein